MVFASPVALAGNAVTVGSVTVSGNAGTRTNSTILKQTAVVAAYRLHKVYFAVQTVLKITLPYTDSVQQAVNYMSTSIKVLSEASTGLLTALTKDSGTNPADDITAKTVTWTFTVPANYSWIAVDPSAFTGVVWATPPTYSYRLNYFTDIFTCPFIADYPDTTGIYRGCVFQADLSRLPCILYDSLVGACKACYAGYTLNNGKCV